MVVNNPYIVVNIDKKAQKAKREKTDSGIYISPIYQYMLYNLQYGPILGIGPKAKELFPEAEIGDLAIFHHVVEEKPQFLIYEDEENEHRILAVSESRMSNQIYAVIKAGGTIIMSSHYILLDVKAEEMKKRISSSLLVPVDERIWEDEEILKQKLTELDKEQDGLNRTLQGAIDPVHRMAVRKKIGEITQEREKITRYIHRPKFAKATILAAHPTTIKELKLEGIEKICVRLDMLIPLSVIGHRFLLSYTRYVFGIFREKKSNLILQ